MKVTVKIEGRAFEVEVGALDNNPVRAVVDGETFEVWLPQNPSNTPVLSPTKAGPELSTQTAPSPALVRELNKETGVISAKTVTAPLPGVIVGVSVQPGMMVKAGEVLCTIEAMKMKNAVRAKRAGQISAVFVNEGQHVKHRQPLMEFGE
ncbi:methylmalonyl-CoA carboxyltransferase 1.3S subunit [Anaerolineae bacterium]|nr:methylmalonyl-CoA carboxyltransferase 1.3S subunit [Anaerolineae bacterium]